MLNSIHLAWEKGVFNLRAANCLPDSMIFFPNELCSSPIALQLLWEKLLFLSEENA